MKTFQTLAAAAVITAAAFAGAPAANAATTSELGCPRPRVANVDTGYVTMVGSFNLKAGPYAGGRCAVITRLAKGTVLYVHCWVLNSYRTPWAYARVKGTGTHGWMSVDNVRYGKNLNFLKCPGSEL
ncbi:hypothetical protein SAMN05444920_102118 [Nonomuraea solani]|uniref:SH3 domain-containing protein n=1 Tax=Nonomuraea solani TaxID=1144553 RepID=A0A1H5Y3F0_9ACTN|nr:hypothetical protein [Nonomuraea solani]SEG18362.1 hypothetical protein SAMN05444920_102118 [Nonomuraea solani]